MFIYNEILLINASLAYAVKLETENLGILVRLQREAPHKGFKVFMDALGTVTAEEGDRYSLEPPFNGR